MLHALKRKEITFIKKTTSFDAGSNFRFGGAENRRSFNTIPSFPAALTRAAVC